MYKFYLWIGTFPDIQTAYQYCNPSPYLDIHANKFQMDLRFCDLAKFYDMWEQNNKDIPLRKTDGYELLSDFFKEINGVFAYLEDIESHFQEDNNFLELLRHIPADFSTIKKLCEQRKISSSNFFIGYNADGEDMRYVNPGKAKNMIYLGLFSFEKPLYLQ